MHRLVLCCLFCSLILIATQATAAVPEHRLHESSEMAHEGHNGATQPAAEHVHPVETTASADKVGLEEKLGERIPLDLVFRDEQGNPVKLADLVTKPTIIAPVYYRCPNVCHFLQGDLARVLPTLKLKAGGDYQVISFSFDETEQPELALRSRNTYYAAMKNQYPEQAWRFLTGDSEAIRQLTLCLIHI